MDDDRSHEQSCVSFVSRRSLVAAPAATAAPAAASPPAATSSSEAAAAAAAAAVTAADGKDVSVTAKTTAAGIVDLTGSFLGGIRLAGLALARKRTRRVSPGPGPDWPALRRRSTRLAGAVLAGLGFVHRGLVVGGIALLPSGSVSRSVSGEDRSQDSRGPFISRGSAYRLRPSRDGLAPGRESSTGATTRDASSIGRLVDVAVFP